MHTEVSCRNPKLEVIIHKRRTHRTHGGGRREEEREGQSDRQTDRDRIKVKKKWKKYKIKQKLPDMML